MSISFCNERCGLGIISLSHWDNLMTLIEFHSHQGLARLSVLIISRTETRLSVSVSSRRFSESRSQIITMGLGLESYTTLSLGLVQVSNSTNNWSRSKEEMLEGFQVTWCIMPPQFSRDVFDLSPGKWPKMDSCISLFCQCCILPEKCLEWKIQL